MNNRLILFVLLIGFLSGIRAQENAIEYTIANDTQVSPYQIEFDLFLYDPDPTQPFELCTVQAGILVNQQIYGLGSVSAEIIEGSSMLNSLQVPTSITFAPCESVIKLAAKAPPGCGAGTKISQNPNNRTRICRIRLVNTIPYTTCSQANLGFCFTATPFPTKLSYYPLNCIHLSAPLNDNNCFSMADNLPLNAGTPAPLAYSVTGGGFYCAGQPGLPVGLAGSEPNVNYFLFRDSLTQVSSIPGTGFPISFGNQTAGTYIIIGQRSCGSLSVFTTQMIGSAVISLADPTIAGVVVGPDSAYEGSSNISLNLNGNTGRVLKWQKRLNAGAWVDIISTSQTYSEIPTPAGSWEYRAVVQNASCLIENSSSWNVDVLNRTLTMKLFLQGLYRQSTLMMDKAQDENGDHYPGDIADLITLSLAHNNVPYQIEYILADVPLPRNGIFTVNLPSESYSSYYLVVNHRNSVETWSSFPVSLNTDHTNYNFTNGVYKAYGYNMFPMGSVWVFYTGDVNQDGIIDSGDMIPTENLSSAFTTGYLPEDNNGDGLIDSTDMSMIGNHAAQFVGKVTP